MKRNNKKSPMKNRHLGKIKETLVKQTSLNEALNLVRDGGAMHSQYQHYTSLGRALDKIAGNWWLTRSDNDRLNDLQEKNKFGKIEVARRTFQTSFCHGAHEDVAMWGLYQRCNPLAIRITIPGKTMEKWVEDIRIKPEMDKAKRQSHLVNIGASLPDDARVESVAFGDLIYVSVADPDAEQDALDIRRGQNIHWDDVVCYDAEDLQEDIKSDWATAFIKDSEWRHERESRLTLHLTKALSKDTMAVRIAVPKYVVENMRFTFSPWLNRRQEAILKRILETELANAGVETKNCKFQRFRRSSLCGALNLGEVKIDSEELMDCVFRMYTQA